MVVGSTEEGGLRGQPHALISKTQTTKDARHIGTTDAESLGALALQSFICWEFCIDCKGCLPKERGFANLGPNAIRLSQYHRLTNRKKNKEFPTFFIL